MRRMYSEQELSVIVYQVMGQYIENGAFNQTIDNYINAYLVEHPIDPTAITGLDIAPKNVTASGNITAPSIIETMSGYSVQVPTKENATINLTYASAVKNGNKVTFACIGTFTRTGDLDGWNCPICMFGIPSTIGSKLYESTISGVSGLAFMNLTLCKTFSNNMNKPLIVMKNGNNSIYATIYSLSDTELNTPYLFRFEVTFLLSDSLI